ncbi:uncharacterized protein LOC125520483 isoform X1 [Triticum urartu]|uniref:uncharacterized protein LOC125520483 isoform X1 n=1 Tax=Triticum urartu TaxID=4572 RepID=UPI0020445C17|nr:uncharacterized protein LOC125520483 isoform X1 [Triticum urartu]
MRPPVSSPFLPTPPPISINRSRRASSFRLHTLRLRRPLAARRHLPRPSFRCSGDPHLNSSAAPTDAAGSGSQHVATLRKLLFRRMLVGVNDGRYFLGLFHCVDKQGNIILQDAVEYRSARRSFPSAPKEERCLGLILIPASCRSSCHVDCFIEEQMALLSLCK